MHAGGILTDDLDYRTQLNFWQDSYMQSIDTLKTHVLRWGAPCVMSSRIDVCTWA